MYQTKCCKITAQSIAEGAALIQKGELVAFPTETVYGLGANALDEEAVRKIYVAKGRPSDNPLIVHVADVEHLKELVAVFPKEAALLAQAFMPGPLTLVLPKKPCIPSVVSGGLDTVGVRIPSCEGARAFLKATGLPIAAPSANISGRPSPTKAEHVLHDLNGRIPLILDGGPCTGGVESTVLSLASEVPMLLRPGLVSPADIRRVIGRLEIHPSVLANTPMDKVASPGMKYKHYSPRAKVMIVEGTALQAVRLYDLAQSAGVIPSLLWNSEDIPLFGSRKAEILFDENNPAMAAKRLFTCLRRLDEQGVDIIFAKSLSYEGIGLSVMNRLLRAAAFQVLSVHFLSTANDKDLLDIMGIYGI